MFLIDLKSETIANYPLHRDSAWLQSWEAKRMPPRIKRFQYIGILR